MMAHYALLKSWRIPPPPPQEKLSWKTLLDNGHLSVLLDKDTPLCSEPDDAFLQGWLQRRFVEGVTGISVGPGTHSVEGAGH